MINKLDDAFLFQQEALSLLSRRQEVLASNIANADTPGYLARDIDFSQQLKNTLANQSMAKSPVSLSLTAEKHIEGRAGRLMTRICCIARRTSRVRMVIPWIWTVSVLAWLIPT